MQTTRSIPIAVALALTVGLAPAQAPVYDQRGAAGDEFGTSIASLGDVDGDGLADYAIGAPHGAGEEPDAGYVLVFSAADHSVIRRFDGWWTGDQFGFSVAGLGDVDGDGVGDLIVGAPTHLLGGGIFVHSVATGALLHHTAAPLSPGSNLGWSVAGPGDVTGDGIPDYAWSAPSGGPGYVAVHSGSSGALFTAFNGENNGDQFGYALDAAGDVDGDGLGDLVVGAPAYDFGSLPFTLLNVGKVYVHTASSSAPLYTYKGTFPFDEVGRAVAGGEDLTGDLVPDIAVGVPFASPAGSGSGRIDVVSGALPHALQYQIDGESPGDHFGRSLDLVSDLSGDGRGDIAAGAPEADSGANADAGRAYVFSGSSGTELFSNNTGQQAGDRMGGAVASGGFFNAGANGDVLFGAPQADQPTLGVADSGWVRSVLGNSPYPSTYCTAKVNSEGCTPWIAFAGCTSQSVSDYFVVVGSSVLPDVSGILIWSYQAQATPFFGGTLCVKTPIVRTPLQTSAQIGPGPCDGQYLFLFDHAYQASKNVPAGATVHFQYWSRDSGFAPPNSIGLTNALAAEILP